MDGPSRIHRGAWTSDRGLATLGPDSANVKHARGQPEDVNGSDQRGRFAPLSLGYGLDLTDMLVDRALGGGAVQVLDP